MNPEELQRLRAWETVVEEPITGPGHPEASSLPSRSAELTSAGVRKVPKLTPAIVAQARRESPTYTIAGKTFQLRPEIIEKFILYGVTRDELSRQVRPYSRLDDMMAVRTRSTVEGVTAGMAEMSLADRPAAMSIENTMLVFPVRCTCGVPFHRSQIELFAAMERAGIALDKILDVVLNKPALRNIGGRPRKACCSINFITPSRRSMESSTISAEMAEHYTAINVQRIPSKHLELGPKGPPPKVPLDPAKKTVYNWLAPSEAAKRVKRLARRVASATKPSLLDTAPRMDIGEAMRPAVGGLVSDIEGFGIVDVMDVTPPTVTQVAAPSTGTTGLLATEIAVPTGPMAAGPINLDARKTREITPKQVAELRYSVSLTNIYLGPDNVYQAK